MSACDVTGPLPRPVLQIHTYLAPHSNTKRGRDQAHKDDTGDDGHVNPPRKCPRILNDWTQAQPHIDKSNRWRQRILAIEERFPTTSFPFRLMTTIIGGMSIVSAFTMFCYHVNPDEYDFRSFVETVAYDAMTNTYDRDHSSVPRDGSSPPPPTAPAARMPTSVFAGVDVNAHIVVPIKSIEGWTGANAQRCRHCGDLTSFCCFACSDARGIMPLHPAMVQYKQTVQNHMCLSVHRRDPSAHSICAASLTKKAAAQKKSASDSLGAIGTCLAHADFALTQHRN